ncbi:MAG: purine-nucleoside phosphorylase [Microthrixaceae bacterium]|nr:purine-nucleoside phosphorylase [Microthrixaceae bacterium]
MSTGAATGAGCDAAHDAPTEPFGLAQLAAEQLVDALGRSDHRLALWLGSGWQRALDELDLVATASTADLAGFHPSGAMGHGSEVHSVDVPVPEGPGLRALVFTGRTHLYEGHGPSAVAHGVRTAAAAGCRVAVLTNAAGCLREGWGVGRPALIRDQLNLTGVSPLTGPLPPPPHDSRHVDLTDAYHPHLRRLARSAAPDLPEGVYAGFHGPEFETPAEIAAVGQVGADLVGQSTVLETIAARQVGLEVLGISLITNAAAGMGNKLSAQEVVDVAHAAAPEMARLVADLLAALAADAALWS